MSNRVLLILACALTALAPSLAAGGKLGSDVEHKNYIAVVNSLDHWTGKSDESARDEYLYYAASRLQAMQINQWKDHFCVRDGYYGHTTKLDIAHVFNVRRPCTPSSSAPQRLAQWLNFLRP